MHKEIFHPLKTITQKMPKTGYQRLKDHLERKKMGLKCPQCRICGRFLKGKLSIERKICSYCFPKTEEGKEYIRLQGLARKIKR